MSNNVINLRDWDANEQGKYYLSIPKDTDLVLFVYNGSDFERLRIVTEHDFIYYTCLPMGHLLIGAVTIANRSCFGTLDEMLPYDKNDCGYTYYVLTYAEYTKLTPQEFHIFRSENRSYSMDEIMNQIEIRRKELLPELFG